MSRLKDYNILTDGEIDLVIMTKFEGDSLKGYSPEYKFNILLHGTKKVIGHINLRIGNTEKIVKYIGHIGYGIHEPYQGNKYSAKACKLVKEIAKDNGLDTIIITCNPYNYASKRIFEYIGATFIDEIDVPKTSDAYSLGQNKKCRYEWK